MVPDMSVWCVSAQQGYYVNVVNLLCLKEFMVNTFIISFHIDDSDTVSPM